jgi:hypothetical protein
MVCLTTFICVSKSLTDFDFVLTMSETNWFNLFLNALTEVACLDSTLLEYDSLSSKRFHSLS